ncbi:MAG: hypothetical protein O3B95_03330 [Chloroflexi bacterium]|nr:hypothetical protein [Chloroflexota bacterium]
MTTSTTRKMTRLLPLVALLAWLTMTQVVSAQDRSASLSLTATDSVVAGTAMEVTATLLDAGGVPIAGELIEFSMSVEFLSNSDDISIGSASTDESGVARIEFTPKAEGDHFLTASTSSESDLDEFAETEITVTPGPQLYSELSPIRVPGANVWMTTAVLLAVWSVFVLVALRIWQIARIGEDAGGSANV